VHISRLGDSDGNCAPGLVGSVMCVKVSVVPLLTSSTTRYRTAWRSTGWPCLDRRRKKTCSKFRTISSSSAFLSSLDRLAAMDGREALVCLLDWLASHRNIFTATCRGCAKHLYFDLPQFKYLPPTIRSWRGIRRAGRAQEGGREPWGHQIGRREVGAIVEEVGVPFYSQCL